MKRSAQRYSFLMLVLTGAIALSSVQRPLDVLAHEGHAHFSAGAPGDPKKPSRTVKVTMLENGKKMLFEPAVIEVNRGEQIRFVITNGGDWDHEFMLATKSENRKHAEVMRKFPNMEHDDPNGTRVSPFNSRELVWRFTNPGEFEFACLIPGHYEAGMHGKIVVK